MKPAIVLPGFIVTVAVAVPARAADPGWKAVERALGKRASCSPASI
jgi:hypothetical protein